MTCRRNKALSAAETAAEEALEHGSSTLEEVVNYVVPRAMHAGQQVAGYVVPVYEDASKRVGPALTQARERIVPLVNDAYETMSDKVQHDVYPRLHDLWEHANENPTVAEASRRGHSAMAALRGDLSLPEAKVATPRRGKGIVGKIFAILGLAALVGAVIVAVRAVLGSNDDGWSPAEPMRPASDDEAEWGQSPFTEEAPVAADPDVDTRRGLDNEQAQAAMVNEGAPVDPDENGEPAQRAAHGEGAYVGAEPPEGFVIKGNERSMKYHTADSAGYERTIADVWFNSEQAAQDAGFTRAQR
ncbi:MAG: hypothetical protein ACOX61_09055 [Brooklawnia sp.]|jgi:hypothetical protein